MDAGPQSSWEWGQEEGLFLDFWWSLGGLGTRGQGTEMENRVWGKTELGIRLQLCFIRNPTLPPWSLSIPHLIFLGNLQWSNLEGLP